jgi:hypothetical protein
VRIELFEQTAKSLPFASTVVPAPNDTITVMVLFGQAWAVPAATVIRAAAVQREGVLNTKVFKWVKCLALTALCKMHYQLGHAITQVAGASGASDARACHRHLYVQVTRDEIRSAFA